MNTMNHFPEPSASTPGILSRALSVLFPYRPDDTGWKVVVYQMDITTKGGKNGRSGPELDAL